jgi:hypothetical protein
MMRPAMAKPEAIRTTLCMPDLTDIIKGARYRKGAGIPRGLLMVVNNNHVDADMLWAIGKNE